jgi:hypothetical protein
VYYKKQLAKAEKKIEEEYEFARWAYRPYDMCLNKKSGQP